jgi:NAD(P)-dependent dehydrogenase (short-subunit alcohol dehydrogenase family)
MVVAVVGGSTMGALLEIDEGDVTAQLRRNVIPPFLAIRHAVPWLATGGGGSIVCISSSAAAVPYPDLVPYGAAKAAVEGLVRGAARELGPLHIRVNALRVGPVRTGPVTQHLAERAALPLGRNGVPADIAAAVRYLAGPESAWVTGQCFAADGGTELIGAPAHLRARIPPRLQGPCKGAAR